MTTRTIAVAVTGMTCGHCVRSVHEELAALPGVTDVHVELVANGASRITITASGPIDDDDIAAAVEEAGYSVAPPDDPDQ